MDLLIFGGTRFLGRHITAAALARGHRPTLFHRGVTNPDLFPDVARRLADRDGGLDALGTDRWDAVIDVCGYLPRVVRAAAERLADRASAYAFISTVSVYRDLAGAGADEASPVAEPPEASVETIDGTTYGPLKVGCEQAVTAAFGARALIVRPGLLVGPYDPTDRFTYWPARVARGGRFVAPPADAPLQVVDARDLADWLIRALEQGTRGTFNVTGPERPLTFGRMLAQCLAVTGADATPAHVSDAALAAAEVRPWVDLPLWLPREADGLHHTAIDRALAAGLRLRPLAETIGDTQAWLAERDGPPLATGLDAEREAAVLARV